MVILGRMRRLVEIALVLGNRRYVGSVHGGGLPQVTGAGKGDGPRGTEVRLSTAVDFSWIVAVGRLGGAKREGRMRGRGEMLGRLVLGSDMSVVSRGMSGCAAAGLAVLGEVLHRSPSLDICTR